MIPLTTLAGLLLLILLLCQSSDGYLQLRYGANVEVHPHAYRTNPPGAQPVKPIVAQEIQRLGDYGSYYDDEEQYDKQPQYDKQQENTYDYREPEYEEVYKQRQPTYQDTYKQRETYKHQEPTYKTPVSTTAANDVRLRTTTVNAIPLLRDNYNLFTLHGRPQYSYIRRRPSFYVRTVPRPSTSFYNQR